MQKQGKCVGGKIALGYKKDLEDTYAILTDKNNSILIKEV